MAKQTNKAQIRKDIHKERRRLEKKLFILSSEDMLIPNVTGLWSVKDILAHVSAWERLFLDWYEAGVQGTTPSISPVGMRKTTIDSLNQRIYEENQWRSMEDILAEFHASHQEIVTVFETISEEDMFTHERFAWTDHLTLADYITGNTCNHYAWANSQITRWMKKKAIERETLGPSK